MARELVLLSGGLDSAVLLCDRVADSRSEPWAVSFSYGQRHRREIDSAVRLCRAAGVNHAVIDASSWGFQVGDGSALLDFRQDVSAPRAVVVPNRNMVFVSMAVSLAICHGIRSVLIAAHAGDHAGFPDCRPDFLEDLKDAVSKCDEVSPVLGTPFSGMLRADIVRLGARLGVDFAATWSCYRGGEIHCGTCGACVSRREGFAAAGVCDPTGYAA